jgi:hypothetical protein
VHVAPCDRELLVPGRCLGVGGGVAIAFLADDVLVCGAQLQAGQPQVLCDVGRRPHGFLLVGTAAQAELVVTAAPQIDAVDAAERGKGSVPVGPGLG